MNYRLRDAVLGLLSTGRFDSKGFADSGRIIAALRVCCPHCLHPGGLPG